MPQVKALKTKIKKYLKPVLNIFSNRPNRQTDALYRLLYLSMHDNEQALNLASLQTKDAFAHQWETLPIGDGLLTDPWFKENVSRILSEEELQIRPSWFTGKEVLDAGCGNGRWSYGLAQLGAHVTAADINLVALDKTKEHLEPFSIDKQFIQTPLEEIVSKLGNKKFDLVFSWGVVHHCGSFNQSLDQLTQCVKEGGILYLYLYGRESLSHAEDLALFKERVVYNTLLTPKEKLDFLLKKTGGNHGKVHIAHDLYAPLINRRLEFDDVKAFLEKRGFTDIVRTIDHTELFIRAVKGDAAHLKEVILPKKPKPYWFERYNS